MPNEFKAMSLFEKLANVRSRIAAAEQAADRKPRSVLLLAVTKTRPPAELISIYKQGHRHVGENYLQEALAKQRSLAHCNFTWHFIGPIQSNKTQAISQYFSWVHSVDRLKIARRLNDQRQPIRCKLNICLQVNISGEQSKSGVSPSEVQELAFSVTQLPNLRLRGLMAIPNSEESVEAQRNSFKALRTLFELLQNNRIELDTLSMGMSGDMEAAIAEGSTIVRIGADIFGPRNQ